LGISLKFTHRSAALRHAATTDKPGSLFAETISGFSNVHFVTFGVSDIDRHNPISIYHHIAHLI